MKFDTRVTDWSEWGGLIFVKLMIQEWQSEAYTEGLKHQLRSQSPNLIEFIYPHHIA